jgi:hypothetical protein
MTMPFCIVGNLAILIQISIRVINQKICEVYIKKYSNKLRLISYLKTILLISAKWFLTKKKLPKILVFIEYIYRSVRSKRNKRTG